MGYAFISYSSTNQASADSLRTLFIQNGISTWMAPYNIPAGSEYAEVIYDALVGCSCLVLILTDNSQNSTWVKKEVNIAISNSKVVVPLKLEDIELNSSMRLYLNDQQIVPVNIIDGKVEAMKNVLDSVRALTGTSVVEDKKLSNTEDVVSFQDEDCTDPWECYRKGYCFEVGDGVQKDYDAAAYWYEKGANAGNPWCQHRMGVFSFHGISVPQNYEQAVKWYTLSAEQNDPSACDGLAECYANGWGVEQNNQLAEFWKKRAEGNRS